MKQKKKNFIVFNSKDFLPFIFFFFFSSFQLEYKFKKQKIFLSKNFKKNKEKSKMKNTILNKKNPPSD